jgi:hypothetical protein
MPAYSVAEATAELAFWKAALNAASKGQSLSWGGRSFTPASVADCREQIEYFQGIIDAAVTSDTKQSAYSLAKMDDPS